MDFFNFDSLDEPTRQATFDQLDALLPHDLDALVPPFMPDMTFEGSDWMADDNLQMQDFTLQEPQESRTPFVPLVPSCLTSEQLNVLHSEDGSVGELWPYFILEDEFEDRAMQIVSQDPPCPSSSGSSAEMIHRSGDTCSLVLPQAPFLEEFESARHVCSWASCAANGTFPSEQSLKDHNLQTHAAAVLNRWPGPCKWMNCRSKAKFNTQKALETHVYNKHIDPLVCKIPYCEVKTPFGKPYDLERHIKLKHTKAIPLQCPVKTCSLGAAYIFRRKDKLTRHMKKNHGKFECHFGSCSRGIGNGFETELLLLNHQSKKHGPYGCCGRQLQHGLSSKLPRLQPPRSLDSRARRTQP